MQITEAFKDKTLVITGGTGSFGSTVHKHFQTSEIGENWQSVTVYKGDDN